MWCGWSGWCGWCGRRRCVVLVVEWRLPWVVRVWWLWQGVAGAVVVGAAVVATAAVAVLWLLQMMNIIVVAFAAASGIGH